jgi:transcriptional regulator with XRE-family HTH domain
MPQDPLLSQIAERCRNFSTGTGVSLNSIASLIGMSSGNFSSFIHGRSGLSAAVTIKLLQLLNMSAREVQMKLGKPVKATIEHFQSEGKPMQFDGSGFVPGQSSQDPNDSTGIDNTWKQGGEPCGDDLLDTLRQVDNFHKQARQAIADYISQVQTAKVNKSGEKPRMTDDNQRSRTPGPRPDRFAKLEEAKQRKLSAEADLKAYRELQDNEEVAHKLEVELARLQLSPAERKEILDRAERSFDSKYRLAH